MVDAFMPATASSIRSSSSRVCGERGSAAARRERNVNNRLRGVLGDVNLTTVLSEDRTRLMLEMRPD